MTMRASLRAGPTLRSLGRLLLTSALLVALHGIPAAEARSSGSRHLLKKASGTGKDGEVGQADVTSSGGGKGLKGSQANSTSFIHAPKSSSFVGIAPIFIPGGRASHNPESAAKRRAKTEPPSTLPTNFRYRGGPVMNSPINVYIIWVGTFGDTQKNYIRTLFESLNPSSDLSNTVAGWWAINSLYYDSSWNKVSSYVALKQEFSISPSQYSSYPGVINTVNGQLVMGDGNGNTNGPRTLVDTIIVKGTFPTDGNGFYLVFTDSTIAVRNSNGNGECDLYCGWHTYYTRASVNVKYSWVGLAFKGCTSCIGSITTNTAPAQDPLVAAAASVVAHELAETASDPLINAWFDDKYQENADVCAWQFGSLLSDGSPTNFNLVGNDGSKFLIQMNYDFTTGLCKQGVGILPYCPPNPQGSATCYTKNTTAQPGYAPNYLDRHPVSCGSMEVMQRFHLVRVDWVPNVQYQITCCKIPQLQAQTPMVQEYRATASNQIAHIQDLDQDKVDCGSQGGYVNSFQLVDQYTSDRPWINCVAMNDANVTRHDDWCRGDLGPFGENGAACNSWFHVTGQPYSGSPCSAGTARGRCRYDTCAYYSYTCVRPQSICQQQCVTKYTTPTINAYGSGNEVIYLDRQDVDCGASWALTHFTLQNAGTGLYRYEYTCCHVA